MDAGTALRTARLVVDAPGDRVLEIGAGTGALTAALVRVGAATTALDVDAALLEVLRARRELASVALVHGDALTFDYAAWAGGRPWRVAGNLPYNVATPLLIALAGLADPPERIVAMIQKDVAERLLARPGSAAYGSLTLAIAQSMRAERAFNVPPGAFFPRPKVVSSVVVLRRLAVPAIPHDRRARFEQVVRAAFAYRRKTLANSLALALDLPRERIAAAIAALDLPPAVRGEALDLRTFAALADALAG
ncbi:MAG: ribosomal RNA small subunit methyltransferase A [Candidatus Eremiobacteraeota bacterium]|nr:ribosomal RNA small subunit methyltransferase A [Candidatus Eremiobacteraeota bacterium]